MSEFLCNKWKILTCVASITVPCVLDDLSINPRNRQQKQGSTPQTGAQFTKGDMLDPASPSDDKLLPVNGGVMINWKHSLAYTVMSHSHFCFTAVISTSHHVPRPLPCVPYITHEVAS